MLNTKLQFDEKWEEKKGGRKVREKRTKKKNKSRELVGEVDGEIGNAFIIVIDSRCVALCSSSKPSGEIFQHLGPFFHTTQI